MAEVKEFIKEINGIYRLKVPFEDLYTSVFLVRTDEMYVLVDCATTSEDVDEWIEPALARLGLSFADIGCVTVTHGHGDHAGGLTRILEKAPNVRVVKALEIINGLEIYPLAGHTRDFIGLFVPNVKTLISGDGFQGAGVGKYRCCLESKEDYLMTLEKAKNDERIENVLFSHEYEPWYRDGAFGRENVIKALEDCKKYVR